MEREGLVDPVGKHFSLRPENTKEPRSFGSMITFGRNRAKGTGYMASSERSGPGVLVLHEFFGLTPSFRAFADRLCDEGFTALCVDLYDGRVAGDVSEAKALASSLDEELSFLKLRAAIDHLKGNWHPRAGVVGFSLGAYFAAKLAEEAVPLDAAVVYYGTADITASGLTCPLLGHFAEVDEWEPLEDITQQFDQLKGEGADVEMAVYPGTGHWFANADVPEAFDAEAAEEAWSATVDFLRYNLA